MRALIAAERQAIGCSWERVRVWEIICWWSSWQAKDAVRPNDEGVALCLGDVYEVEIGGGVGHAVWSREGRFGAGRS